MKKVHLPDDPGCCTAKPDGAAEFIMDVKLANYRAEKKRKYLIEETKRKWSSFFTFGIRDRVAADTEERHETERMIDPEYKAKDITRQETEEDYDEEEEEFVDPADIPIDKQSIVKWILYVTLWGVLFLIFLELQFGAVYFVISLLVFICLNTRTRKKRRGEKSAYSVFNKNCESINGTVSADDLQRQFLFGGIGIR